MIEKVGRKAQIARSYKVRQPIDNFKIRVKIMQQKSLLADLFENETDVGDTNFLEREERTFNWQEKVLGPAEVKFYAEEKNCITQSQLDYRRDILQGNVEESRLYSYIDEDGCYPEKDLLVGSRSVTKLSKRNQEALPCQRNRKPFTERYNRAVIDEFPNKERIRTNHYLYKELEVMHLVVDLTSKNEESSIVNEALLCTVTFDRVAKTLTVNPDFTIEEEPYGIESSEMNYDYWIFHDSQGQTQEELEYEVATLQREMQKLQLYKNAEKFKEMKVPESGTLKYFINLEILSAKNFAYDYLFVNYVVSLPQNWEAAREDALLGRTQRCIKKDGKAYFSYVSEIVLNYNKNTDEISTPSWPQLFLSVGSLDKWTRYRIEGYGSMFVPSDPGSHNITVHTWRPAGDFINLLRRFFTGGTYELEDINYCGIPQNHQDVCLEKSNLKTVPSGSIKIKLNIVQQTLESEENLRPELQRNSSNRGSNPEEVLAQFKAARERMIQTKNIRSE